MNPLQVSKDSRVSQIIDGIVFVMIGVVIGVLSAQVVAAAQVTTTTKTIQRVPLRSSDTKPMVDAPDDTFWFEQI